jgi:hypothetical protein
MHTTTASSIGFSPLPRFSVCMNCGPTEYSKQEKQEQERLGHTRDGHMCEPTNEQAREKCACHRAKAEGPQM